MTDQPNSSNDLLPCPFCGSEAKLHSYGSGRYSVSCSDFNCTVIPGGKLAAIKAWNTRASTSRAIDGVFNHEFLDPTPSGNASKLAKRFHETYERLAPSMGYETREESAVPWEEVPENNKRLMIAVCEELLPSIPSTERVSISREELVQNISRIIAFSNVVAVDGETAIRLAEEIAGEMIEYRGGAALETADE
jgi:hypothetical protein